MQDLLLDYFFIIHPILFIGMWFLIVKYLRTKTKMIAEPLPQENGVVISKSKWGSANINGVNTKNCVKLIEYNSGYLLKMMYVFGNGRLWIPKSSYTVVEHKGRRALLLPEYKKIVWGEHKVTLYGDLAKHIS